MSLDPYPRDRHRDGFTVSTDPARLDLDAIHAFLLFQILDHHTADVPSITEKPLSN